MKFSRFAVSGAALVAGAAMALTLAPATTALPVAEDATPMTTITMRVTNCEGCKIMPQTFDSTDQSTFNGPKVKVTKAKAVFEVPTAKTVGMVFLLYPVKDAGLDAQPLIAMSYDNAAAGTPANLAKAKNAKYARPCWAGTTEPTAFMSIRVRWTAPFQGALDGQGISRAPIAWAAPAQPSLAPGMKVSFKRSPNLSGVLATQDVILCKTT